MMMLRGNKYRKILQEIKACAQYQIFSMKKDRIFVFVNSAFLYELIKIKSISKFKIYDSIFYQQKCAIIINLLPTLRCLNHAIYASHSAPISSSFMIPLFPSHPSHSPSF